MKSAFSQRELIHAVKKNFPLTHHNVLCKQGIKVTSHQHSNAMLIEVTELMFAISRFRKRLDCNRTEEKFSRSVVWARCKKGQRKFRIGLAGMR
jgi:hypothetical protein